MARGTAGKEVTVVRVDITCDPIDEDETPVMWTFLHDARDQALIQPGAAVDIVDKPAGMDAAGDLPHLIQHPGDLLGDARQLAF
jgi:hypothetical protein